MKQFNQQTSLFFVYVSKETSGESVPRSWTETPNYIFYFICRFTNIDRKIINILKHQHEKKNKKTKENKWILVLPNIVLYCIVLYQCTPTGKTNQTLFYLDVTILSINIFFHIMYFFLKLTTEM